MEDKMAKTYGMDIGTCKTKIWTKGKGITLSEPTFAAYDTKKEKVVAVGKEAREMFGRTPPAILAIRPVRSGVIADFEVAKGMLTRFIKKVSASDGFSKKRLLVSFPARITEVERRAIEEIAYEAGASEVMLCEAPLAIAAGAGLPVLEPFGTMVVDLGGGVTEVSVISLGDIVVATNSEISGDEMDQAIVSYVRKNRNVLIGDITAETIKIEVGKVPGSDYQGAIEVSGRELTTGRPQVITVTSDEVADAIHDCVDGILETVRNALDLTPPELSADIFESGIFLTGGGAMLRGLPELLSSATGITINVPEDPTNCAVRGLGKMLSDDAFDSSIKKAMKR